MGENNEKNKRGFISDINSNSKSKSSGCIVERNRCERKKEKSFLLMEEKERQSFHDVTTIKLSNKKDNGEVKEKERNKKEDEEEEESVKDDVQSNMVLEDICLTPRLLSSFSTFPFAW